MEENITYEVYEEFIENSSHKVIKRDSFQTKESAINAMNFFLKKELINYGITSDSSVNLEEYGYSFTQGEMCASIISILPEGYEESEKDEYHIYVKEVKH